MDDYLNEQPNTDIDSEIDNGTNKKMRITMAGIKKNSDLKTDQTNGQTDCTNGLPWSECNNIVNEGGCLTCRECGWSKCD